MEAFLAGIVVVICIFVMQQREHYLSILISGLIEFVILGALGSAVYYRAYRLVGHKSTLARTVGTAYALGILLQFLNNNIIRNDMEEVNNRLLNIVNVYN